MAEEMQQPQQKPRLNPQDYRNQDLVNKLMAATPSYLYSPTMGQHNFFFSEMLRSLVQNKRNESMIGLRNAPEMPHQPPHLPPVQQGMHLGRRPRKRSWSQQRPPLEVQKESAKEEEPMSSGDRPLELTSKHSEYPRKHINKMACDSSKFIPSSELVQNLAIEMPAKNKSPVPESQVPSTLSTSRNILDSTASTSTVPPSDLILPPPPPVWYPPLYPPYGIDPLHFFIDLRVSGHIYDRKKEILAQSLKNENSTIFNSHENISKNRLGSAFSVPKPRTETKSSLAMNLSNNTSEKFRDAFNNEMPTLYESSAELKENSFSRKNTNYVMQNLPRIYSDLTTTHKDPEIEDIKNSSLNIIEDKNDVSSKSDRSYDEENNNYHNLVSDDETIAVDEN